MLEAREIVVKYGNRVVVDHVSLLIEPREILAILGPNGAGKSTLVRALNGGLKPVAGAVIMDGLNLIEYSRRTISRRIAVVAQETDVRFPVTVLEFVLGGRFSWAGSTSWGWETDHDLDVADAVLKETELTDLQHRLLNELSGGERQRAVLARALATEAACLLLDEPTANLDLAHQSRILSLVRNRCDSQDVAALVITHDINLAAQFADNVLLLNEGKAVASGPPAVVLVPDLIKKVFAMEVLVDAHPITGAPRVTPVHALHRQSNNPRA